MAEASSDPPAEAPLAQEAERVPALGDFRRLDPYDFHGIYANFQRHPSRDEGFVNISGKDDGGVLKKIIKAGTPGLPPPDRSWVSVDYYGTFPSDGIIFESSEEDGTLEFQLGVEEVMKGWDIGISSMMRGEIAILRISPDYAYGDEGSPPKIPGGETLDFHVELVSFIEEGQGDFRKLSPEDFHPIYSKFPRHPSRDEGFVDISENSDGGVLKKIVKEGCSDTAPPHESRVAVDYFGTFPSDGLLFETTEEKGPFEFQLGVGDVIKGWDIGISSMKRGEVALLRIRSDYAYGDQGSPPLILGGQTLDFQVELVRWLQEGQGDWRHLSPDEFHPIYAKFPRNHSKDIGFVDVTENTDGGVLKRILRKGEGDALPPSGSKVSVEYVATFQDGMVFETTEEHGAFEFEVGLGKAIEGWDVGIMSMRKGEIAIVRVRADYAYGEQGLLPKIPGGETLDFKIELVRWRVPVKDPKDMTAAERTEQANKAKELGNNSFKEQDWVAAISDYEDGIKLITYAETNEINDQIKASQYGTSKGKPVELQLKDAGRENLEDEETVNTLSEEDAKLAIALLNNCAAARLKIGDLEPAIIDCSTVLDLDPDNVKALFRRSQGYLLLSAYHLAIEDATRVLELDQGNKEASQLLQRAEVASRQSKKKEKALYNKMFG